MSHVATVRAAAPTSRAPHIPRAERVLLGCVLAGAVAVVVGELVGTPWPWPPVPTIGHVSGMLAGYAAVILVALVARVPLLERTVGADRLARWHAHGGRTTLVLMVVHAVFATAAVGGVTGADPLTTIAQVLALPWIAAATVGTLLIVAAGILSARAARKRLRYETWHLVHLGMYVGIALAFVHELAGPDLAGRPTEQLFWSLLYAASFGLLIRYRIAEPLLTAAYHDLRVEAVIPEAPGVTTIVVRGRGIGALAAESGQFFRWRFLTRSTWSSAHPFSLSAPPTDDRLRLTVKDAGDGTAKLRSLRPGTRVVAEGPYGAMTERRRSGRGVLLVAGGVGITPMRALFESLDTRGEPLTLLYRASSEDQLVFRGELEEIAARRDAHLVYVVGSSRDPDLALTPERLRRMAPDIARRDVYICASARFSAAARTALRGAGVPLARIHQEDFAFG